MSSAHKALIGKWAFKKWYIVHAPAIFKYVEIGEVPADSPEKLLNRTIEISLFELTRDLSHIPIKLKFQIYRVEGDHAYTRFKQQELTRDYVRSLVRRGSSKIVAIHDVCTTDNAKLRVQVLIVTAHRCNTSHKKAIRAVARARLEEYARMLNFVSVLTG
jgi:small subunit ribosomal protein S3Ae